MEKLKYLVIHCTATPEGRDVSAADILRWHLSPVAAGGRGWSRPGYSNLFTLDGQNIALAGDNGDEWVQTGEMTNGATGINRCSKHIVYAGGCDTAMNPKDTRTEEQRAAMAAFVTEYATLHPDILIAAHYNFANKACPSFNVQNWLLSIGINPKNIFAG